jgi:hypothetical protein
MEYRELTEDELIIRQTSEWVKSTIVGYNFCPFAYQEVERNTIRYHVVQSKRLETSLEALMFEFDHLDSNPDIETTLVVFPDSLTEFDEFLKFIELAEPLLTAQGYEGIYQLATFHPKYQFTDASPSDPANYTNRSPYPTVHIIRESSIEAAVAGISNPEQIPQRNIKVARKLGSEVLQEILDRSLEIKK